MLRLSAVLIGLISLTGSAYGEVSYCNPSDVDARNEQALMELLLSNYSNLERPKMATNFTYNLGNKPEFVEFEVRVDNVWDISSKRTTFEYKSEVWLQWVDCRLSFKSLERGGSVESIVMSYNTLLETYDNALVWLPMPVDYNAVTTTAENSRTMIIYVEYTGVIRARLPQRGTARCPMNFREVPFDKHTCSLVYASPEFPASEIRYVLTSEPAAFTGRGHLNNAVWEIKNLNAKSTQKRVDLSENRGFIYSAVEVSFRIEREPYYYIVQAVLPTLLFWAISYVGFFINWSAAPARSAIHMSAILILVNHLKNISDTLPTISYRTWLTEYVVSHLVIAALQMVAFAAVFFCNERLGELKKEESLGNVTGGLKIKLYSFGSQLDKVSRVHFFLVVLILNLVFLITADL